MIQTKEAPNQPAPTVVSKPGQVEFCWIGDRCIGCARCEWFCPVNAIDVTRSKQPVKRKPACTLACPVGLDVPRYNRLISQGKYAEAVAVIRERLPFPGVCGYVCLHPCEAKCQRTDVGGNIAIRALKRFAVAQDTGLWKKGVKTAPPTGKRIAIIGGGPAGMTVAYYLARLGHSVAIFTSSTDLGGKMLESIPEYELPRDVLQREISDIIEAGVDVHTGTMVEAPESLCDSYDGLVIATGLQGNKFPPVGPLGNVQQALRPEDVKYDSSLGRVVVLGNGGCAYEVASKALRSGATESHIVASGPNIEQEVDLWLVDEALNAGVIVHPWRTFARVVATPDGQAVEYFKARAYGFDADGKLEFDVVPDSACTIPADTIINAVEENQANPLSACVRQGKAVFVAGDASSELRSVVNSVAAGRWTASQIDRYLGGSGDISEQLAPPETSIKPLEIPIQREQVKVPTRIVAGNVEQETTLTQQAATREAQRCLSCDACYDVSSYSVDSAVCTFCGRCVENCYRSAVSTACQGQEPATAAAAAAPPRSGAMTTIIMTILVVGLGALSLAIVLSKLLA